jgi:hypothetical protein
LAHLVGPIGRPLRSDYDAARLLYIGCIAAGYPTESNGEHGLHRRADPSGCGIGPGIGLIRASLRG